MFGHSQQCSEVFGKSSESSEVARTFSKKKTLMTRQKSHAFDSEKVGRFMLWFNFILGLIFISLCFGVW